jgi:hypothetical protein
MTRSVRALLPAVLLGAMALPMVATAGRLPHLKLVRSFPAKDTVLTSAPDAVRLWMSERADLVGTKVEVAGADGVILPTAKPTREAAKDAPIVARFTQPVGAGRYTVAWKTMSRDGHVVNGTFAFTVTLAK